MAMMDKLMKAEAVNYMQGSSLNKKRDHVSLREVNSAGICVKISFW